MKKEIGHKEIRTRFAPSPTGELHIGGLRTALSCYLLTKQKGGSFILRIEDTDQKRLVEGAEERLVEAMIWAGVKPSEGVLLGDDKKSDISDGKNSYLGSDDIVRGGKKIKEVGQYGPYIQSKRLNIYQKHVQQLLDEGKAYHCFCSAERLDKIRKEQQKNKQAPKYDRHCLKLSPEEIKEKIDAGEKYVVRFKVPAGETVFEDEVFGIIKVKNETLDDQIIMKSDGFPTYHLAVVVDDYLMEISHIFRGAEWLPSTPKHVLLYQAFGWEEKMPKFIHMANILNKNRKKLSKREGSVSVNDFRLEGYPAEALINFIALLGWNPKTEQEIFTIEELIEQFDIKKMNKAGGVFDLDRLAWISNQHIKRMSIDDLYKRGKEFLEKQDFYQNFLNLIKEGNRRVDDLERYIKKVLTVEQERLSKFTEIGVENKFFFQATDDLKYSPEYIRWKNNSLEETKGALEQIKNVLQNIDDKNWTQEKIQEILLKLTGDKRGECLFPLRWILTGQQKSPSPFEVAWVLGKEESLKRIDRGLKEVTMKI